MTVLADPAFDPRREVLLETGCAGGEPAEAPGSAFQGSAAIAARGFDAVTIDVEASSPGYLVLVEAFHPGWTAAVDGEPAPLLEANLLFRAVRVPAGRHSVEMRYWPLALDAGLALAGLAAAALIAAAARARGGARAGATRTRSDDPTAG
jgi:hypothetical protein